MVTPTQQLVCSIVSRQLIADLSPTSRQRVADQSQPRGGYSLCDGWYICAAVLTPFFHFGRIEHDLFGVFYSSTNNKAIFWGTKTTNFYKNRSFWPQIQFFPRSFWVQFSAASGTPPSVFRPSTPPGVATHFQSVGNQSPTSRRPVADF